MIVTAKVSGECWRCRRDIEPGEPVQLVAGHTGYQHPEHCPSPLRGPLPKPAEETLQP